MKKVLLFIIAFMLFCPKSFAETDNIALLTKNGFFEKVKISNTNPYEEVRKVLCAHLKLSNAHDYEKLSALYAENYINADGLNKETYFDLIKKTWESYPDIKYNIFINNVSVEGNLAVAQVSETAIASTDSKSGAISERGLLESSSNSVYYFEKINNEWKITSDHIIFEKTYLRYGSAKETPIELSAPNQIAADTPYTATLSIIPPKDSLIIASIGKENITYPQTVADEIFRKLPDSGTLERIFKSNKLNLNEYAVASFGITKAEIKNSSEIKIYITGLGFVMTRINVIPANSFVKASKDEKDK